ncbi:hypothetical protein MJH12_15760, partial [bacterium]|nr:hypothetical protein [bacterium]
AEGSISQESSSQGAYIFGGVACSNLDTCMFQNSTHIQYNIDFSPFEGLRDMFYRMVLDDHVIKSRTE